MSDKKSALIVIDVQESFRHMPYWSSEGLQAYLARQQELTDGAKAAGIPVIQIFHTKANSPFARNSEYVRTLNGFSIDPDAVFYKERHSALAGTGLDIWLIQQNIGKLIISGIRTEQCCETTARHASDLGFEIDYVTEATFTFPMMHASGKTFSAEDIKTRTELVLTGRFAKIVSVAEALSGFETRKAA